GGEVLQLHEGVACVEVRMGMVWRQLGGAPKIVERADVVALLEVNGASVNQERSVVSKVGGGPIHVGQRPAVLGHLAIAETAPFVRFSVVGIDREGALEAGDRVLVAQFCERQQASVALDASVRFGERLRQRQETTRLW